MRSLQVLPTAEDNQVCPHLDKLSKVLDWREFVGRVYNDGCALRPGYPHDFRQRERRLACQKLSHHVDDGRTSLVERAFQLPRQCTVRTVSHLFNFRPRQPQHPVVVVTVRLMDYNFILQAFGIRQLLDRGRIAPGDTCGRPQHQARRGARCHIARFRPGNIRNDLPRSLV